MLLATSILILGAALQPTGAAERGGARIEFQGEDYFVSVGAFARYSWPFGALDDRDVILTGNAIIFPDNLNYSNLFDPGAGYSLEASVMFVRPPPPGRGEYGQALPRGPTAGVYVSFQADSYEGDRTTDENTFIEPDDLDLATALVGLKVTTDLGGGAWGEARLGLGIVRYEAVDARVSLSGGGETTQELLDESQQFASEFRYRFSARLGPLGLVGGLGIRFMGGPDAEDSEAGDLLETHALWTFDVDVGLELGF